MKNTKLLLVAVIALLFGFNSKGYSQNWGFALPFGVGGFAINGKNWTAGYGGASVAGGRGGWGFQLPNGAGFYNGNGGAPGYCGGGAAVFGGGGGGAYYSGPQGQYVNAATGWSYGPAPYVGPSQTRPARYLAVRDDGGAIYQTENGNVWVQNPF